MDGFALRRERKKNAIQKAAGELFFRKGVKETTIKEIAREAEVSQVTIYNYFGSKDGLVREIVLQIMEDKWREFEKLEKSKIPFPEKIREIVDSKREITKDLEEADFLQPVFFQDPQVLEYINRFYRERALPSLKKLIAQGREGGHLPSFISEEAILAYLEKFKEITRDPNVIARGKKEFRQDLIYLFFYGLFGEKPEKRD